jgi:hypothetical protein
MAAASVISAVFFGLVSLVAAARIELGPASPHSFLKNCPDYTRDRWGLLPLRGATPGEVATDLKIRELLAQRASVESYRNTETNDAAATNARDSLRSVEGSRPHRDGGVTGLSYPPLNPYHGRMRTNAHWAKTATPSREAIGRRRSVPAASAAAAV